MEKEIHIVGIVGSGKMGQNLFNYLLDFDFQLVLVCQTAQQKEEATKSVNKKLKRALKNQLITEEAYQIQLSKIDITESLNSLENCHLVIEAITENKALKQDLFSEIKTIVKPECILASNSSSILASDLGFGDNLIGIHFFYPISLKNIVELMITDKTDIEIVTKIENFLHAIKRKYILLKPNGAFILNRLFLDFQNLVYQIACYNMLSFKEIDTIVKKYFFPIGVFEFFDSVGIDVMHASIKNYSLLSSKPSQYGDLIYEMTRLINRGYLGQKTKRGFYDYELPLNSQTSSIEDELEQQIYNELKNCYVQTATSFVEKGICDKTIINNAVKEYMDIEKGPFEI